MEITIKRWWQSKTIQLAVLQATAGLLAAFLAENPDLQSVGWFATAKSVADIGLRFITSDKLK